MGHGERGETGFMGWQRREASLGAIKADVVEKLKIENRMRPGVCAHAKHSNLSVVLMQGKYTANDLYLLDW